MMSILIDICEGDDCIDWLPATVEVSKWERIFNRLGFDIKV